MVKADPSPGKYRRIAELGHGGMATVYLCVAQGPAGFNKLHVLKCLRSDLVADSDALKMFMEEARISARLSHPNIVLTYEVGHDGEHPFITMEYVEGQTLEKLVRRARAQSSDQMIPLRIHLEILVQVLAGLHFAHELTDFDGKPLHLVHRDVSPHNVMVTYEGHVKVLDFGIAKVADSSEETRNGVMKGKFAYMAPEQCMSGPVDRRADIYAVGVMLWQAITGQRMWQGVSGSQVLTKVLAAEIPEPQHVAPNADPVLAAVCMKALARNPSERYSSAAELQAALEDYLTVGSNRPGPRELGQYVRQLAQDSLTRIRAAIEHELKKPPQSSSNVDIPVLWGSEALSTSGMRRAVDTTDGAVTAQEVTSRRSKLFIGLGTAAALTLLAIITGLLLRSSPGAAQQAAAPPMPFANPTVTNLIVLKVAASPPEAKLYLDDTELSSNPATIHLPRDMAAHRVGARASGYEAKSQLVRFDSDAVSADIVLDPIVPAPAKSSTSKAHAPAPLASASKTAHQPVTPTAAPSPAPTMGSQMVSGPPTPTTRALDTSNPWASGE